MSREKQNDSNYLIKPYSEIDYLFGLDMRENKSVEFKYVEPYKLKQVEKFFLDFFLMKNKIDKSIIYDNSANTELKYIEYDFVKNIENFLAKHLDEVNMNVISNVNINTIFEKIILKIAKEISKKKFLINVDNNTKISDKCKFSDEDYRSNLPYYLINYKTQYDQNIDKYSSENVNLSELFILPEDLKYLDKEGNNNFSFNNLDLNDNLNENDNYYFFKSSENNKLNINNNTIKNKDENNKSISLSFSKYSKADIIIEKDKSKSNINIDRYNDYFNDISIIGNNDVLEENSYNKNYTIASNNKMESFLKEDNQSNLSIIRKIGINSSNNAVKFNNEKNKINNNEEIVDIDEENNNNNVIMNFNRNETDIGVSIAHLNTNEDKNQVNTIENNNNSNNLEMDIEVTKKISEINKYNEKNTDFHKDTNNRSSLYLEKDEIIEEDNQKDIRNEISVVDQQKDIKEIKNLQNNAEIVKSEEKDSKNIDKEKIELDTNVVIDTIEKDKEENKKKIKKIRDNNMLKNNIFINNN